jgi:hypothetical protein
MKTDYDQALRSESRPSCQHLFYDHQMEIAVQDSFSKGAGDFGDISIALA